MLTAVKILFGMPGPLQIYNDVDELMNSHWFSLEHLMVLDAFLA